MCNKIVYARPLPFWLSENYLPIQFVERLWFETSYNVFMSKNGVSIKKIVFTKGLTLVGGEDERIVTLYLN
jgi:hypothetical protein